jgi:hypothetical protein
MLGKELIEKIMTVAREVSPTAKERAGFDHMLLQMHRAGEEHRVIVQALVAAIYDGITYGNWPKDPASTKPAEFGHLAWKKT